MAHASAPCASPQLCPPSTNVARAGESLLASASEKAKNYGAATTKSDEHNQFVQDGRRFYYLDVVRIVCVGLVVVNHGGTSWSDQFGLWNEMYVQQWVLQWLYIVCGLSFAMSSRGSIGYQARLGMYFAVGVFINWCAWACKGMDWRGEFWNVIFQFWFIFGLMMYIACLTPLKIYLMNLSKEVAQRPPSKDLGLAGGLALIAGVLLLVHVGFRFALAPFLNATIGHGLVTFQKLAGEGASFWGMPTSSQESMLFIQEQLSYLQVTAGSFLILIIFPRVSNRVTMTNWLVLLNVFFFRCFFPRGQFARIVDGLDFTMIGLANFYLGLSYRKTIGEYMVRYWFVVLFVFSLLLPPGTWGRFDETGITSADFRVRYHLAEFAMVVLLLSAGERLADASIFTEDKLDFLNWWALYLFLFHRCIHLVIPHPFNWLVVLCLAPLCWLVHGSRSRTDDQQETTSRDAGEVAKAGVASPALSGPSDVADVEKGSEDAPDLLPYEQMGRR